jgi:putative transposase
LKCLTVVDDATHEAVAVVPEHTIGGDHLTRIMDEICSLRGRPAMIRTDNGAEFTGKAMLTRAHRNGVTLID